MFPIDYITTKLTFDEWKKQNPEVDKKRKIILKQGQSPGDIMVFTRAVGDLKLSYPNWEIDVRSPAPEVWNNNPHLTPLNESDPNIETHQIGYGEINKSGWHGLHFSDAFRHELEQKLNVPIKKTGIRPELFISNQEKSWYNQAHTHYGWNGPFWLLNAGRKQDNELKQYHRWQEVVDIFNETFKGRIKLIQIGHDQHVHPKLKGVYNAVGKTNLRELIRLGYWADGTIGPISFQFVMSAALPNKDKQGDENGRPAVVVAGAKEGVRWQLYPHIQYIYTNGVLPCADWDGCWLGGNKGKCKNLTKEGVPKCFDLISPERVVESVSMYYNGGILQIPSDKEHEEHLKFEKQFRTAKIEHGSKKI